MYKKLAFIVLLGFLLGVLLYLKPFKAPVQAISIIETFLPDADIVGSVSLLELLTESTDLMLFNQIAQRQFLTSEFVLSMAKQYGLDVQSSLYVFANERGDLGSVIPLYTSEKLKSALDRISLENHVTDTIIGQDRVYHLSDFRLHIFHRDNFLFIYYGDFFYEIYNDFIATKNRSIGTMWKGLFANDIYPDENLVLYSECKSLKSIGIDHAFVAHDSDSSGFQLKSYLSINDSIPFFVNDSGQAIKFSDRSKRTIDLHLNSKGFSAATKDLFIQKLSALTSKISFPISDFVEIWDGDFCFEEGGYYMVQEKYIETELDDNFEPTQIEKTRYKNVPRYSLMFTVKEPAEKLIQKLLEKGILTREDDQFRFLFSPQLKLKIDDSRVVFYSTKSPPKAYISHNNSVQWSVNGTELNFKVDSLKNKKIYGSLEIPMRKILESISFL